jgi:hypothetical protein
VSGGNENSQHVWLESVLARDHGANLRIGRNRMISCQLDLAGSNGA